MTAERRPLPDTRESITHRFGIYAARPGQEPRWHKFTVHVGLYPDGRPGEVFIRMRNQHDDVGALLDAMAIAFSVALQHGAPVESIASKYVGQIFHPGGRTTSKAIPMAQSPVDYLGRWMMQKWGR